MTSINPTQSKIGSDWQDDELDAIIADYFDMLTAEREGRRYVKSRHNKALMSRIGRTHRSIEFKHQNISAVLEELGMDWIPGYKPKRNYQNAIFGAIDRYLTSNPSIFDFQSREPAKSSSSSSDVFVPPPETRTPAEIPEPLRRLVRKFDPVERDYRNRSLGKAGEEFVVNLERRMLTESDRSDLARKVRWVSEQDGDGAGYDILSFNPAGRERLLEVKTTAGSARTPFFLTRNEREMANERPEDWRIYRVHLFARTPRIFTIEPPLEKTLNLRPETWLASF